jgi:hypothetical protein
MAGKHCHGLLQSLEKSRKCICDNFRARPYPLPIAQGGAAHDFVRMLWHFWLTAQED